MVYVPVEGVEEFIYLGSKQCSTQDWTCLCSDEFSTEGMELQFSQYQHQSIPVPSTDKVCSRDVHETFLAEAEAETEAFWPETEARPRRLSTCPRRDRDRGV